ncbi:PhzF family phenazine biosynthesis isomerase [Actinophytocola sp.]|uniref:PhzF family phenazine biosynthesis isomerase n=1 Tax=Actinophytocola sp. TaxID=1872138 RepID=UPI00389A9942
MILRYAAFTTDPATGNPAGVVLDAEGLTDEEMQRIATDVGYSETAFAVPVADRRFAVRYFSPLAEVPFCGHATIATAVALAERDGPAPVRFDTKAGEIPVHTELRNEIVATLTSVPTRSRPATDDELTRTLTALNWSTDDVNPAWPVHVAFAGNDHLMLAAATRARLATLDYDFEALRSLMLDAGWTTLQLFWPETDHEVHARDPFPVGGVVEDPATGAAAAAFGGYLRAIGRVTEPRELTIVQGEDMGRRSELTVTVHPADPRVRVTGTATRIPA